MTAAALAAAALWLAVLVLPWRPWSTRERIQPSCADSDAGRVPPITVLIPARDEEATIRVVLEAVSGQAGVARIVVVDDRSRDRTAEHARRVPGVEVVDGRPTPPGWSGKLWAQQQGLARVRTPLVLLLDADIRLARGMVAALYRRMARDRLDMGSVMARLPAGTLPEKLMLPAFVFFFKLLYPFAWVNRPDRPFAAAAGGCVLVRREALEKAGAFAAWKEALIDDCELARRVRDSGERIWIGLSHGVCSLRRHPDFGSILETVRRTAYAQLQRSPAWLLLVTAVMLLAFAVPPWAVLQGALSGDDALLAAGLAAWLAMAVAYAPQVAFARLRLHWAPTLPAAGLLFLVATLDSARRHHFGGGAGWKGRRYRD